MGSILLLVRFAVVEYFVSCLTMYFMSKKLHLLPFNKQCCLPQFRMSKYEQFNLFQLFFDAGGLILLVSARGDIRNPAENESFFVTS